jgi:hypothetical protein
MTRPSKGSLSSRRPQGRRRLHRNEAAAGAFLAQELVGRDVPHDERFPEADLVSIDLADEVDGLAVDRVALLARVGEILIVRKLCYGISPLLVCPRCSGNFIPRRTGNKPMIGRP